MSSIQTGEKKLSPAIVIGGILLFIGIVFAYKFFVSATIHLVLPAERAAIAASDLSFKWTCNRKDVQLVLEVYDGVDLILRQFVDKDSYTPDDGQKAAFEADHLYYWRVIPNPDVKQKYSFNQESKTFYITTALALQEEVQEEEPVSKPAEEPQQQRAPELPYDPNSTAIPSEGLF